MWVAICSYSYCYMFLNMLMRICLEFYMEHLESLELTFRTTLTFGTTLSFGGKIEEILKFWGVS